MCHACMLYFPAWNNARSSGTILHSKLSFCVHRDKGPYKLLVVYVVVGGSACVYQACAILGGVPRTLPRLVRDQYSSLLFD